MFGDIATLLQCYIFLAAVCSLNPCCNKNLAVISFRNINIYTTYFHTLKIGNFTLSNQNYLNIYFSIQPIHLNIFIFTSMSPQLMHKIYMHQHWLWKYTWLNIWGECVHETKNVENCVKIIENTHFQYIENILKIRHSLLWWDYPVIHAY